jgi:uncharacterized membrane protein (UPF0127 family)
MPSFIDPLIKSATGQRLTVERTGATLASQLLPAFDSRTRRTGLLRHESLAAGSAMIIAPSNAVHTFGMAFDIDIVFVARDGRVLKIRTAVPRRRMAAALRAFAVIELPARTVVGIDLREGDRLAIRSL